MNSIRGLRWNPFGATGIVMAAALLWLSGCGGSSSSGGGGSSSSPGSWLYYTNTTDTGIVTLHALSPDNPDNPREVHHGLVDNPQLAPVAVTAGARGTDAHQARVVYNHANGHFYQANTRSDGAPQPRRISSEDAADPLCDLRVESDYANIEQSLILYARPVDGSCASPAWYFAFIGDGADTRPRSLFFEPEVVIRDPDTGAIRELVVRDSITDQLKAFDPAQRTWRTIADSITNITLAGSNQKHGKTLFLLNNAGFSLYHHDTGELEAINFSASITPSVPRPGIALDGHIAFVLTTDYTKLAAVDLSADTPTIQTLDEPATAYSPTDHRIVSAGKNRIAWSYRIYQNTTYYDVLDSVALDGSNTQNLYQHETVNAGLTPPAAPGGWLFVSYSLSCPDISCPREHEAVRIEGSAQGSEYLTAQGWAGKTWSNTVTETGKTAERVFYYNGTHLLSRNAADPRPATEITLGELPGDWNRGSIQSFSPHALVRMERSDVLNSDVLLVDPDEPHSLKRITDNQDDTRPVPGF